MAIKESLLTVVNSISDSDFVRAVTSAGASRKLSVSNLAKHIVETYSGSTIAGSAQSVQSAVDAVAMKVSRTNVANGSDFNTCEYDATLGSAFYRGDDVSTMTNRPSPEVNACPWALDAINVNSYTKQILHVYTARANIVVYERIQRYVSGGKAFGEWEKMPTRTEVDALNSKINWASAIELPLSNCSAYNSVGVRYKMVGPICHVLISISGLTANNRVKIATLPAGSRPLINSPFLGSGGTSYTAMSHITVTTAGEIYMLSDDTYATAYFNFICF